MKLMDEAFMQLFGECYCNIDGNLLSVLDFFTLFQLLHSHFDKTLIIISDFICSDLQKKKVKFFNKFSNGNIKE
jgi:hypothetical protein